MGNRYLYEDLIALFTLVSRNAHSAPDLEAARLQLEEHRIALFADPETDRPVNVVERQLKPLAEGIAKAYGCAVEWVEHTGRS